MTTAITVRLDEDDHATLEARAKRLGVRPGTLARMLVHAGLAEGTGSPSRSAEARAGLERLVRRSQGWGPTDAVSLVAEARTAFDPGR